jgi:hypothetical protein
VSEDPIKAAFDEFLVSVLKQNAPVADLRGKPSFGHIVKEIRETAEFAALFEVVRENESWRTGLRLDDPEAPQDPEFFINTTVLPVLGAYVETTGGWRSEVW